MDGMCGRYAVTTDPAKLAAEIDALNEVTAPGLGSPPAELAAPSYNVAPTSTVLTVVKRRDRSSDEAGPSVSDPRLRVRAMRWGLVPPWTKEVGKGPLLINARAETLLTNRTFAAPAAKGRRALVPMDGWYEWRVTGTAPNGRPVKTPYYLTPVDGSRLFMGALWSAWRSPAARAAGDDSAWLSSTTIITTDAVGPLRAIHDRMPLIMPREYWDAWLDPDVPTDPALLQPPAGILVDAIEIREVAPLVNRAANDGPELIEPVAGTDTGQA